MGILGELMPDVRVLPQSWLWKPRTKPIRMIEIHATRGNTTPALQKSAALNWVQSANNNNGGWGSSFSHVIGTDGSQGTVLDDSQMPTYSAGYGGPTSTWAIDEYAISYELAQSQALEPFTDACYRRAAKEVAIDCLAYAIPATFLNIPNQSGVVPAGLVRHDRCQNGVILGKTDPGTQFNEAYFLSLLRAEMQPVASPPQLQEEDDMMLLYHSVKGVYLLVNGYKRALDGPREQAYKAAGVPRSPASDAAIDAIFDEPKPTAQVDLAAIAKAVNDEAYRRQKE